MADPGFAIGGHGSLTRLLFGENVCKNERNGSCSGEGHAPGTPPRSTNVSRKSYGMLPRLLANFLNSGVGNSWLQQRAHTLKPISQPGFGLKSSCEAVLTFT